MIAFKSLLLAKIIPPPTSVKRGNDTFETLGQSMKARLPPVVVRLGAAKLEKRLE